MAGSLSLPAQTINYPISTGTEPITLNGTATLSGTGPRVAPGFDTSLDLRITNIATTGNDGLAFVIHDDPTGANALGYGQNIFFSQAAISNALIPEIDIAQTVGSTSDGMVINDPSGSHLSLHVPGANLTAQSHLYSIGQYLVPFDLSDGNIHNVRILHPPGTIDVYFDGGLTPVISAAWDFATGGNYLGGGAAPGLNLGSSLAQSVSPPQRTATRLAGRTTTPSTGASSAMAWPCGTIRAMPRTLIARSS